MGPAHFKGDHSARNQQVYGIADQQPVDIQSVRAAGQSAFRLMTGDFRLQPGSPALALGFQPIDLGAVGPRVEVGPPPKAEAKRP